MSPDDSLLEIYRDVEAALAGKGFRCEAF